MLDEALDKNLLALIEQWNIAERRIKKAEQVRGEEVVASAIFELRYAGRKLIDATQLLLTKDWQKDARIYGDVRSYLEDATEDCVKAKHDAIDAILSFVTSWFSDLEKSISLAELTELFPDYMKHTATIALLQDKITESRGNRYASRDGLYDEIERAGFDDILSLFEQMLRSKERVQKLVASQRRKKCIERWALYIGSGAAVLLLIFEVGRAFWTSGH